MQTFVEVVPSETVKFTASLEYFKIKDPFKETMYPDVSYVNFGLKLQYLCCSFAIPVVSSVLDFVSSWKPSVFIGCYLFLLCH